MALDHKHGRSSSTRSPSTRRTYSHEFHQDFGEGSSHSTIPISAASMPSPFVYPQLPALHVQTLSESFQSPYTLTVPGPQALTQPALAEFLRTMGSSSPGPGSSSSSSAALSLAPSDSFSASVNRGRRGKSRASSRLALAPPPPSGWNDGRQARFEERVMHLTASAGFPLSWVENPEWLAFCHEFLPAAKSPSRKVLTQRLLPHTLTQFQSRAMQRVAGKNATASCDGWTGENFHHYIAFMVSVNAEVCHPNLIKLFDACGLTYSLFCPT